MDPRNSEQRCHNGGTPWLTCDEVAFVQRLGTHTEWGVKTPRVMYLQRYIVRQRRGAKSGAKSTRQR